MLNELVSLILQIAGLCVGGGTLWKVIELAQWKGRTDERLDGFAADIERHEDDIAELQRVKGPRR